MNHMSVVPPVHLTETEDQTVYFFFKDKICGLLSNVSS